jgi:hypothetical protein
MQQARPLLGLTPQKLSELTQVSDHPHCAYTSKLTSYAHESIPTINYQRRQSLSHCRQGGTL